MTRTAIRANPATAPTEMNISIDGLALIKHWEGLRLKPYLCASGKMTIGYGHLITPDQMAAYRDGIDLRTAERLLRQDIRYATTLVAHSTAGIVTKQAQFDVLVSFVFNVGSSAFIKSTLLRDIQKRDLKSVPGEMKRWIHDDHGKVIDGLVNRRKMEARIWNGEIKDGTTDTIEVLLGLRRR